MPATLHLFQLHFVLKRPKITKIKTKNPENLFDKQRRNVKNAVTIQDELYKQQSDKYVCRCSCANENENVEWKSTLTESKWE